jgi:beta-glucosidase/6-phospho-beta-glucosidase/beta-galactosidase
LDEYELTQHYQLWKTDFDLVAETGVNFLRWGIPWYRVQPAPDRWDWSWVDEVLDYMVNVKGLTPILDLMHYGTPLWLEDSFINSSYPEHVAAYTAAVVERYKSLVRYYTPLNEPMVNADMCGNRAEWPPYLQGDDGRVKMTISLARGIVLATQAIQSAYPGAVTIQVEALWRTFTGDPSLETHVAHRNVLQYLCFDLVTGRVGDDHPLLSFLFAHGATEADLIWFRRNAISFDIFGANFYPWSQAELKKQVDGSLRSDIVPAKGDMIATVIQDVYSRYRMPVLITETSANADIPGRLQWMDETLEAVRALRSTGIPVLGYTWFPVFSMVDWEYRSGEKPIEDYLIHLGLYDSAFDPNGVLQRHGTPLVENYQKQMRRTMPTIADC